MHEQELDLTAAQELRDESGTDAPGRPGDKDAFGRRARILAGMTLGAVIVTAVAAGDPTPTMTSWA